MSMLNVIGVCSIREYYSSQVNKENNIANSNLDLQISIVASLFKILEA